MQSHTTIAVAENHIFLYNLVSQARQEPSSILNIRRRSHTNDLPIHPPRLASHGKAKGNGAHNLHGIKYGQQRPHTQGAAVVSSAKLMLGKVVVVILLLLLLLYRGLAHLVLVSAAWHARVVSSHFGIELVRTMSSTTTHTHLGQWQRTGFGQIIRAGVVGPVEEDGKGDHLDAHEHGLDAEVDVRVG
jgi:hypothetical protein